MIVSGVGRGSADAERHQETRQYRLCLVIPAEAGIQVILCDFNPKQVWGCHPNGYFSLTIKSINTLLYKYVVQYKVGIICIVF